jgi:hypothetical protein
MLGHQQITTYETINNKLTTSGQPISSQDKQYEQYSCFVFAPVAAISSTQFAGSCQSGTKPQSAQQPF